MRSRYNSNNFTIIFLLGLAVLLALALAELGQIKQVMRAQLDYWADADMCWQQVEDYTARACYVERDGDNYHWYSKGE